MKSSAIQTVGSILLSVLINACSTDLSPITRIDGDAFVSTSVSGQVVDESGEVIGGASIRLHDGTATSNSNGLFVLTAVLPAGRCVVTATKVGYFPAARADKPRSASATWLVLTMRKRSDTLVRASDKISLAREGIELETSAQSLADNVGLRYSGNANAAIRSLDPSEPFVGRLIPGDLHALRSAGSPTMLLPIAMASIVVTGTSNQPLQPNINRPATLRVTIPESNRSVAPQSVPMWHFDDINGIWKEAGTANKQGSLYIAQVTRFGEWCFADSGEASVVNGRVVCRDQPAGGLERVTIDIGPQRTTTERDGSFSMSIPSGRASTLGVDPASNSGYSGPPVAIPALAPSEHYYAARYPLDKCPSYLKAKLVNDSAAGADGWLLAAWSGGSSVGYAPGGSAQVMVPAGVLLRVGAVSTSGCAMPSDELVVAPLGTAASGDLGELRLCAQPPLMHARDIPLVLGDQYQRPISLAFSGDGSRIAAAIHRLDSSAVIEVHDVATGALAATFGAVDVRSISMSGNGGMLLANERRNNAPTVSVWNVLTDSLVSRFAYIDSALIIPNGKSFVGVRSGRRIDRFAIPDGTSLGAYQLSARLLSVYNDRTLMLVAEEGPHMTYSSYVVEGGKPEGTYESPDTLIPDEIVVSPNGRIVGARVGNLDTIYFYNRAAWQPAIVPYPHNQEFAISNSNSFVGGNGLYSIYNGSLIRELSRPLPTLKFSSFAFALSGRHLAGVFRDVDGMLKIRIWIVI